MTKVYTRKGDEGQTSLIGGNRISKGSLRLESYGTIDELGSCLGLLINYLEDVSDKDFIENLQRKLFIVSALLATPADNKESAKSIEKQWVEGIEKEIDKIDATLPPLHCFILTGGCKAACIAHICRTVCRRAERCIVRLAEKEYVDANLLSLVNRISDYLFLLARKQNLLNKIEEKNAL